MTKMSYLALWGLALVLAVPEAFGGFRPPAIPLVTCNPSFSLWIRGDRPNEYETTHWFHWSQAVNIFADIDGNKYRLVGMKQQIDPAEGRFADSAPLKCVNCKIAPLTTTYRYKSDKYELELSFLTAKLPSDLDVFSRPVSYVTVKGKGMKNIRLSFWVSPNIGTYDGKSEMEDIETTIAGMSAFRHGQKVQRPLTRHEYLDMVCIDWGYLYIVNDKAQGTDFHFMLAYDDIKTGTFLGEEIPAWWRRDGKSFETMIGEAERDYRRVKAMADRFDSEFMADVKSFAGQKYCDLISLAYRQSFGACQLMAGPGKRPFFFSKECSSNGCMGTTDVFYSQFAHQLLLSVPLAKATLEPTMVYASSGKWKYPYAPHDVGLFPFADGQFYGMTMWNDKTKEAPDSGRMPVEECANMLILLTAIAEAEGNVSFAAQWWPTVEKWAKYLWDVGYDPGEQICTDDFTGPLAHNSNLSIKSIIAQGAYARMCGMLDKGQEAAKFRKRAEESVVKWLEAAKGGAEGGYRIAFDKPNTWGLKYNLVWDRILGLELFPKSVAEAEMAVYRKKSLDYGPPLDNRNLYATPHWMFFAGSMTGKIEDLQFMSDAFWKYADETPDRNPLTDWYFANNARECIFQGRPVVGSFFIPMLGDRKLVKKWQLK